MAIRKTIQPGEFTAAINYSSATNHYGQFTWSLKMPCDTMVFASVAIPKEVKMFIMEDEDDSSRYIILFQDSKKHMFKIIPYFWLPSQIAEAIETTYREFVSITATPSEDTTPLRAKFCGTMFEDYLVPNIIYNSVKLHDPAAWIDFYCGVDHHETDTVWGTRITIDYDIGLSGAEQTIIKESNGSDTNIIVVENAHESVQFPYLTPRGFIVVVASSDVPAGPNMYRYCTCYSAEDLAAALTDPTSRSTNLCSINRPFSDCPIRCMPSNNVTGDIADIHNGRPSINTLYANPGVDPVNIAFNQNLRAKPLPTISAPSSITRVNGQYIDVSTSTAYTEYHAMRVIGVNLVSISSDSISIGQSTMPLAIRTVSFIDMIAAYKYGPVTSTFVTAPNPSLPSHEMVNKRILHEFGGIVTVYNVFNDRVTMVKHVTDLSDETQFDPDHIEQEPSANRKVYRVPGIISMYHYGSTLVLVYADHIDIYKQVHLIDFVLDKYESYAHCRRLFNYYVEFAGMYLALRCRAQVGAPVYVFANGDLTYNMPRMAVGVNELIISHAPASVILNASGALEWISSSTHQAGILLGYESSPIIEGSIYRNSAKIPPA